jgi:Mg2+/Co2+ transporter CorB
MDATKKAQNSSYKNQRIILNIMYLATLFVNNVPIPRTENYICLGVNTDEKLTWKNILI